MVTNFLRELILTGHDVFLLVDEETDGYGYGLGDGSGFGSGFGNDLHRGSGEGWHRGCGYGWGEDDRGLGFGGGDGGGLWSGEGDGNGDGGSCAEEVEVKDDYGYQLPG